jgi:hypothetical protein
MARRPDRYPGAIVSADVICLDVLSSTEVWWKSNRICSRSTAPQTNAAKALRALGVPESTTIHFRRFGRIVRAVVLGKLLQEVTP